MKEVNFEDIKKANATIMTTDIKGKDYAEVNQRIKAFRMVYPSGTIDTDMIYNENGVCIFKAVVGNEETVLGVGHAYEKEGSTFINKTSYIENCETSAVGRALGMAGFGIDTSVASAEEVANAMKQQEEEEKKRKEEEEKIKNKVIDKKMEEALLMSIDNNNILDDDVFKVLEKYGYSSTTEIKMKDYKSIVDDLKKIVRN